jgi:hypothetical protein
MAAEVTETVQGSRSSSFHCFWSEAKLLLSAPLAITSLTNTTRAHHTTKEVPQDGTPLKDILVEEAELIINSLHKTLRVSKPYSMYVPLARSRKGTLELY